MQNDSVAPIQTPAPVQQPQPTVSGTVVQPPIKISKEQNVFDYILLIIGGVAVFSLLFGGGLSLFVVLIALIGLGGFSIIRGLSSPKTYMQNEKGELVRVKIKKERSLVAKLGMVLIILVAIPIIGYLCFFAFIIIAFSVGGGPSS